MKKMRFATDAACWLAPMTLGVAFRSVCVPGLRFAANSLGRITTLRHLAVSLAILAVCGCPKVYDGSDGAPQDVVLDAAIPPTDAAVDTAIPPTDAAVDAGAPPVDAPRADVLADASLDLRAPRQIAPLSMAMVTSRRPTLRWELGAGFDGARIELCHDRPCTRVIEALDVAGRSARPSMDLPPGVVFWRLRGRSGTTVNTTVGPTWPFVVGVRSADVDTQSSTTLDVDGDGYGDVLVGAGAVDRNGGRAYVYRGSAMGLMAASVVTLTGPVGAHGGFGYSVASAGDVNGDGYGDVIGGAYQDDDAWTGSASVFLGGASGISPTLTTTLHGLDGPNGTAGRAVAGAGDVNGDGYADVIVGASSALGGVGRAYLYLGGGATFAAMPATTLTGPDGASSYFGRSVAAAGDVDGDGFADVFIGASGANSAYLYLGSAAGLRSAAAVTLTSPAGRDSFYGESVAMLSAPHRKTVSRS